jgi:hypothetical protein
VGWSIYSSSEQLANSIRLVAPSRIAVIILLSVALVFGGVVYVVWHNPLSVVRAHTQRGTPPDKDFLFEKPSALGNGRAVEPRAEISQEPPQPIPTSVTVLELAAEPSQEPNLYSDTTQLSKNSSVQREIRIENGVATTGVSVISRSVSSGPSSTSSSIDLNLQSSTEITQEP